MSMTAVVYTSSLRGKGADVMDQVTVINTYSVKHLGVYG